jgi:hypothetical protein
MSLILLEGTNFDNENSPLLTAIELHDVEMIRILVKKGADVNEVYLLLNISFLLPLPALFISSHSYLVR